MAKRFNVSDALNIKWDEISVDDQVDTDESILDEEVLEHYIPPDDEINAREPQSHAIPETNATTGQPKPMRRAGPEPMVFEVAQENLVDGKVSTSLDAKLTKEYGTEWKEENNTKIYMIPPVFTDKGTKKSKNGTKAEREVYKALEEINDKRSIADHFERIKMFGFVFHGQMFDNEQIDFVYVTKWGLIISEVKGFLNKSKVQSKYDETFDQLQRKVPKLLNSLGLADIPIFKVVAFPLLCRCYVELVDDTHVLFKDDLNDLKTWLRRKGFLKAENVMQFQNYVGIATKFLKKYHLKGNYGEYRTRGIADCTDNLERNFKKFYTKEQAALLDVNILEDMWISGGAGTGKTLVLKERAKRLTELYLTEEDKDKILVITYNVPIKCDIKEWMKENTKFDGTLVRVRTFSAQLRHILRAVPDHEKSNEDLLEDEKIIDFVSQPHILKKYFKSNYTNTLKFHHILVDEAQDLSGNWLSLLRAMLSKNQKSNIWIFEDPFQKVRRKETSPDVQGEKKSFEKRSLTKVFRNTHNIFEAYSYAYESLSEKAVSDADEKLSLPLIDHNVYGLKPEYIPAESDNQLHSALVTTLKNLQVKGVPFSDVAIITYGSKAKIDQIKYYLETAADFKCVNAEESARSKYLKRKKRDPAVTIDSYQRFKGLETKVLIFCIPPEWKHRDEDIYVGFSRAFCLLIVIGTAKAIDEIKSAGTQN